MSNIFRHIKNRTVVVFTINDAVVFKRVNLIGESFLITEKKFRSHLEARKFVSQEIKILLDDGYIEVDDAIHTIQVLIKLTTTIDDDDEFWNLITLRDEIEEEIEEEFIEKSFGDYVGSSDVEIVYNIWNYKEIIKDSIEVFNKVLSKNGLKNWVILSNEETIAKYNNDLSLDDSQN